MIWCINVFSFTCRWVRAVGEFFHVLHSSPLRNRRKKVQNSSLMAYICTMQMHMHTRLCAHTLHKCAQPFLLNEWKIENFHEKRISNKLTFCILLWHQPQNTVTQMKTLHMRIGSLNQDPNFNLWTKMGFTSPGWLQVNSLNICFATDGRIQLDFCVGVLDWSWTLRECYGRWNGDCNRQQPR